MIFNARCIHLFVFNTFLTRILFLHPVIAFGPCIILYLRVLLHPFASVGRAPRIISIYFGWEYTGLVVCAGVPSIAWVRYQNFSLFAIVLRDLQ